MSELNPRPPSLLFSWVAPTQYVNGEPITDPDKLKYRLYQEGALLVDEIGETHFRLLMEDQGPGIKRFTVTTVKFGLESPHSEEQIVDFFQPSAPTDFRVAWDELVTTSVSGSVG